ncbi:hypothetical protein HAX54_032795, partial [Datura stramonium]|nr:hypothetical protein [Datura stramonium]
SNCARKHSRDNPNLQLVKFLLAKSPVLMRIIIEASIYGDYGSLKSLIERSKFQCASPKAE